jgi:hypothetical protein
MGNARAKGPSMVRGTPLLPFVTWLQCRYVPVRVERDGREVRYMMWDRSERCIVGHYGNDKKLAIYASAHASGVTVQGRVFSYMVASEKEWRLAINTPFTFVKGPEKD